MEPRYKEGPKNRQNLFAITSFRYIEILFDIGILLSDWGKENGSLYRGRLRYQRPFAILRFHCTIGSHWRPLWTAECGHWALYVQCWLYRTTVAWMVISDVGPKVQALGSGFEWVCINIRWGILTQKAFKGKAHCCFCLIISVFSDAQLARIITVSEIFV